MAARDIKQTRSPMEKIQLQERPAWSACCFSWSGISSVELPICLLSLAAIFFVKVIFFQGLSLACLIGLLLFVKWDVSIRLLVLLLCAPVSFSLRSRAFDWPELLICLLSVAAICCEAGPLSLLGRPAAFGEVGVFWRVSSPCCLVLVAMSFCLKSAYGSLSKLASQGKTTEKCKKKIFKKR